MTESLYGVDAQQKEIWVYLEQDGGNLAGVSLELLGKGRELADLAGWPLVGLLMGHNVIDLGLLATDHGADEVLIFEDSQLEHFSVDAFVYTAYHALKERKPSIFLLGATPNGRDLAGRLAVRLRTGLNADCTDLRLSTERGILVCEVSGFGGGVLALIEMERHRPQMATVRPGVFLPGAADTKLQGTISRIELRLPDDLVKTRVIERVLGQSVDLTKVPALVAGGRGVDGNFGMLRELADLLGGDIGATRPPVDEGHIERERQIGQTGVVCRPKVAIACGISGAFHFIVGIQEAEIIVAINSDPEAPIFDFADYCIVGDVQEIVPALINQLRDGRKMTSDAVDEESAQSYATNREVSRG
jgi:electron transfer flavoprotein alpha subunit